jgi:hypothetical protein
MTFLQFLEDSRFPIPPVESHGTANTSEVSCMDIGYLEDAWKPRRAIRDPQLAEYLCLKF